MKVSDHTRICDRLGLDRNSPECRAVKQEIEKGRLLNTLRETSKETALGTADVPYVWAKVRDDMSREEFETTIKGLQKEGEIQLDYGSPISEKDIMKELDVTKEEMYIPTNWGNKYRIRFRK